MRFALIFIVALAACGQPAEAPVVAADEMPVFSSSPIGGWVFRDASLGEAHEDVRRREKQFVTDSAANRITIQVALEAPHAGTLDAQYIFAQGQLQRIRAEFTLRTDADREALFDALVTYFDSQIGQSAVDDGFAMWSARDSSNQNFEVLLLDEHREVAFPYLSLLIRRHGN